MERIGYSEMRGIVNKGIWGIVLLLSWAGTVPLDAHPAHAKPVKYPFVVGFERFYTNLDSPDHLANGGLILLNELNCVACHKPPEHLAATLTGRAGTRLAGVADRFEHLDLEMMIRNPRFVKTDTIMPSMFSGPDRDLDEIEALKHFLSTLKEPKPQYPDGDLEDGKILYHKIGCVACHAPELDYRPPWVPANIEIYQTGLPSVPMNLADRYPREVLIDLVINPSKHRPAGRMPKFDLTEKEAIDIGTYLNSTPKPELPELLQRALAKAQPFAVDPVKVEKGRGLFVKKNCVACHSGVVEAEPVFALPMAELNHTEPAGCLSNRPPGGTIPAYGLDELQKKAIVEALKRISETRKDTPEKQVDWIMASRNCYSCHERNHTGGTESAREIFFTASNPDAVPNGRWATQPPALDGVGAKLTDEWWQRSLYHKGGSGSVRDFMALRMPIYRQEDLGDLEALIKQIDKSDDFEIPKGEAGNGHALVGYGAENCVSCHGLGDLPPPGIPSVSLNETVNRLRPDYFHRLLSDPQRVHPGIPMPKPGISKGAIADIWAYLSKIDAFPLPDGLLRPEITELKPVDRPIVIRTAVEGFAQDGLAVGFPGGFNGVFDLDKKILAATWEGRFLDQGPDWNSKEIVALKPPDKYTKQPEHAAIKEPFTGYRIDKDKVTVMFGSHHCTISSRGDFDITKANDP